MNAVSGATRDASVKHRLKQHTPAVPRNYKLLSNLQKLRTVLVQKILNAHRWKALFKTFFQNPDMPRQGVSESSWPNSAKSVIFWRERQICEEQADFFWRASLILVGVYGNTQVIGISNKVWPSKVYYYMGQRVGRYEPSMWPSNILFV